MCTFPSLGLAAAVLALMAAAGAAATSAFDMDVDALAATLFPDGLTNDGSTMSLDSVGPAAAKRFTHLIATTVRSGVAPSWLASNAVLQIAKIRLSLQAAGTLDDDAAVVDALLAARKTLAPAALSDDISSSYPYWGFVPKYLGVSIPSAKQYRGSTPCFASVNLSSTLSADNKTVLFNMSFGRQTSVLCSDYLMIGAPGGVLLKFLHVDADKGALQLQWSRTVSTVASKAWLLVNKGVHVFRFNKAWAGLILDVLATITFMSGAQQFPLKKKALDATLNFLHNYVESSPRMHPLTVPRPIGSYVINVLNESYVQSGDALCILRYDGLGPLVGWHAGFSAGHATVAVRDPDCVAAGGQDCLAIYESNAKSAFWPVEGVQKTPFKLWMARAELAEYNVLLAPLSPEASAAFDSKKAIDFFQENAGNNYGFLNMLWTWIDVKNDNFPCLPPNYDYCFGRQIFEMAIALLDDFMGDSHTNPARQSLNFRTNTTNLSVTELMQYAGETLDVKFSDVYIRPEQDSWMYHSLKNGKPHVGRSNICCVFVCGMWKSGGMFEKLIGSTNAIQCSEQTLWDIFSMKIYDDDKLGVGRPQVCRNADPTNPMCQLMGNYTFHATPDFNTRSLYKNMGQSCSSLGPNFTRHQGC